MKQFTATPVPSHGGRRPIKRTAGVADPISVSASVGGNRSEQPARRAGIARAAISRQLDKRNVSPANSFCEVKETEHDKIFRVALEWCAKRPAWKRICDIPNSDALYVKWDELPPRVRRQWEKRYPWNAEEVWREFGNSQCKVPYGFVGTDGVFYPEITDLPLGTNFCMVFKIGRAA